MKGSLPDSGRVIGEEQSASQSCDDDQKPNEHETLLYELAIESGIEDRETLEKLVRFDINADNFQALALAPL